MAPTAKNHQVIYIARLERITIDEVMGVNVALVGATGLAAAGSKPEKFETKQTPVIAQKVLVVDMLPLGFGRHNRDLRVGHEKAGSW